MSFVITKNYNKKDNNWFCNQCSSEIYSGKKPYVSICSCIDKKSQYKIYIDYLTQYYEINGSLWACKKCHVNVGAKREQHALICKGTGTRGTPINNIKPSFFSKLCDLGCGCESKFFYRSGKAYCSKQGNGCSIKKQIDREKKLGINPWNKNTHPKGMLGKTPFNKGLTKQTSELVAKNALAIKESIIKNGHAWSKTSKEKNIKEKLSIAAKAKGFGGITKGGGRGKKGWYKGFHCDSSWELAYVIYCLEHNIPIKRNTERRTYEFKGKTKGYFPDFIVSGELIEIKGYTSKEWEAKLAANPDVKPLYKEEMKPILKYAVDKYGKDYVKMYEKK